MNTTKENRVLALQVPGCGELLTPVLPKIKITKIKKGCRFQFAGDRNRVREVVDVDGEFVLVKTLGDSSDLEFYKVHYSWLKKNETGLKYLR